MLVRELTSLTLSLYKGWEHCRAAHALPYALHKQTCMLRSYQMLLIATYWKGPIQSDFRSFHQYMTASNSHGMAMAQPGRSDTCCQRRWVASLQPFPGYRPCCLLAPPQTPHSITMAKAFVTAVLTKAVPTSTISQVYTYHGLP